MWWTEENVFNNGTEFSIDYSILKKKQKKNTQIIQQSFTNYTSDNS